MNRRSILLILAVVLGALAYAQAALAAGPCCEVTAVDAKKGIVTLKEIGASETFTVETDAATAAKFKVGQKVETKAIGEAAAKAKVSATASGASAGVHCKCGKRADGSCWCSGSPGDICYSPGCPRVKVAPK